MNLARSGTWPSGAEACSIRNPTLGNGLKLQRSFSRLGETCQPAVSKPYGKEILEQLKLQHFRDAIETRLNLARSGTWPSGAEACSIRNPTLGNGLKLQRSFSRLGETCQPAVSKPYRKEVVELKLELFRDAIETRLVNLARFGTWRLELKLRQFINPTRGNGVRVQRSRSSSQPLARL